MSPEPAGDPAADPEMTEPEDKKSEAVRTAAGSEATTPGPVRTRECGCRWSRVKPGIVLFSHRCVAHAPMFRTLEQWEFNLGAHE